MVEKRQAKLFKINEAINRRMSRMIRDAAAIKKLIAQRNRQLKGPAGKLKRRYQPGEELIDIGGGAVEGLDDELPVL